MDSGTKRNVNGTQYSVYDLYINLTADDWLEYGTTLILFAETDILVPKAQFVARLVLRGAAHPENEYKYYIHSVSNSGVVGGDPTRFNKTVGDVFISAGAIDCLYIVKTTLSEHLAGQRHL